MAVPPQEPLYQYHLAPADKVPFTCNVELVPEHIGELPLAETGSLGISVTLNDVFTQAE